MVYLTNRFQKYSLSIQRFDLSRVLFGHLRSLQLQSGGQVTAGVRKVLIENVELLDLLSIGDSTAIAGSDSLSDVLLPLGAGTSLLGGCGSATVHTKGRASELVGEPSSLFVHFAVQSNETHIVFALVTNHHDVGDSGQLGLDSFFDGDRGNVLNKDKSKKK